MYTVKTVKTVPTVLSAWASLNSPGSYWAESGNWHNAETGSLQVVTAQKKM